MDRNADRIIPLDQLDDFKVAEGDPDVRGWDVLTADGRRVGEVDDLLIDKAAMKVRYLDVDIDDDLLEGGNGRHILIPIGYARLDEDSDRIFVDTLNSSTLAQIPEYRAGNLTRDYETSLHGFFSNEFTGATATTEDDFYDQDSYRDDHLYGAREGNEQRVTVSEEQLAVGKRQRSGVVVVDKQVETEHARETVPILHEEVVVERRPASGMTASSASIHSDEIRIPVAEEELVVEKRAVPKEEIVVRKQERVENEVVEADLRQEHVDIHREGDVNLREQR